MLNKIKAFFKGLLILRVLFFVTYCLQRVPLYMDKLSKRTYGKIYYFDKNNTDNLSIKWQSGIKAFYIYHNKTLVEKFDEPIKFISWKEIEIPFKGKLKLKFYTKLMDFEVKYGDFYLENFYIHSKKILETVFVFFILFALLCFWVGIDDSLNESENESFLDHYSLTLIKAVFYSLAAFFMFKKQNIIFYLIGVGTYIFGFLLPAIGYLIFSIFTKGFSIDNVSLLTVVTGSFSFLLIFTTLILIGHLFIKHYSAVKDYNKYLTSLENIDNEQT